MQNSPVDIFGPTHAAHMDGPLVPESVHTGGFTKGTTRLSDG
jgi:hypothetical protein